MGGQYLWASYKYGKKNELSIFMGVLKIATMLPILMGMLKIAKFMGVLTTATIMGELKIAIIMGCKYLWAC